MVVTDGFIERMLNGRRSLEQTLADFLTKIEHDPRPELARTVELLRAEIEIRGAAASRRGAALPIPIGTAPLSADTRSHPDPAAARPKPIRLSGACRRWRALWQPLLGSVTGVRAPWRP
jgi:hypothetical protein